MSYVTGNTIRTLRIKHGITQKELAEKLNVSDKTISKWETEKGLPDISIVEELAKALHVSLTELFTGDLKTNENVSGNIKRIQFYVCPICGNIITAVGEGNFSCCGITLLKQEAETAEEEHSLFVETVDNEFSIVMKHSMSKGIMYLLLPMSHQVCRNSKTISRAGYFYTISKKGTWIFIWLL